MEQGVCSLRRTETQCFISGCGGTNTCENRHVTPHSTRGNHNHLKAHARAKIDKQEPTGRGRQSQIRTSICPPDVGDLAAAASGLAALAAVGGSLGAWTGSGAGAVKRRAELRSAREGRKQREAGGRC